jgi:maspardin
MQRKQFFRSKAKTKHYRRVEKLSFLSLFLGKFPNENLISISKKKKSFVPDSTLFLMGSLEDSEAFKEFQETVALQKVVLDQWDREVWQYYAAGPKSVEEPLVMLPGVSGAGEQFFLQVLGLSAKGYRVLSVVPAGAYSTSKEWVRGFTRFLDALGIHRCHLFGANLGGYLSLCFAQSRPKRVGSVILCNSFADTQHFADSAPCSGGVYSLMPAFVLQRFILQNFPQNALEVRTRRSVDFMVDQVAKLRKRDLVSRLSLVTAKSTLDAKNLPLKDRQITIVDTLDEVALPEHVREEVYKFFPDACMAFMKDGGNFPYLSRSSEFNMQLQVHLRKHAPGVEIIKPPSSGATSSGSGRAAASSSSSASSSSAIPEIEELQL